ncbi:Dicer-like protein 1 [Mycoemilia scoparia]|uniref:Dicer-like protein 1 n=1 Tax=Mycoemilia scoparia TaxID=417184 RepID=A0A9W8A7V2_9FUNG|nr:Dicer-like protein 1 [Mycoemilia scoparia]
MNFYNDSDEVNSESDMEIMPIFIPGHSGSNDDSDEEDVQVSKKIDENNFGPNTRNINNSFIKTPKALPVSINPFFSNPGGERRPSNYNNNNYQRRRMNSLSSRPIVHNQLNNQPKVFVDRNPFPSPLIKSRSAQAPVTQNNQLPGIDASVFEKKVYELALSENIIAVLESGVGAKISLLLIQKYVNNIKTRNIYEFEEPTHTKSTDKRGNLILLLSNADMVREQQASAIRQRCQCTVSTYPEGPQVMLWDRDIWTTQISASTVHIMSPEVVLHGLRSKYFGLAMFDLILLENCQEVSQLQLFRKILANFYDACPVSSRPRVFGCSKINSPPTETYLVDKDPNAPIVDVVQYGSSGDQEPTCLSIQLQGLEKLHPGCFLEVPAMLPSFIEDLGSLGADILWLIGVNESIQSLDEVDDSSQESVQDSETKRLILDMAQLQIDKYRNESAALIVCEQAQACAESTTSSQYLCLDDIESTLSPKLLALFKTVKDIISKSKSPKISVIVRNFTATVVIDKIFSSLPEFQDCASRVIPVIKERGLRPLGSLSTLKKSPSVQQKYVNGPMVSFAALGLEAHPYIQQCDFCIWFDFDLEKLPTSPLLKHTLNGKRARNILFASPSCDDGVLAIKTYGGTKERPKKPNSLADPKKVLANTIYGKPITDCTHYGVLSWMSDIINKWCEIVIVNQHSIAYLAFKKDIAEPPSKKECTPKKTPLINPNLFIRKPSVKSPSQRSESKDGKALVGISSSIFDAGERFSEAAEISTSPFISTYEAIFSDQSSISIPDSEYSTDRPSCGHSNNPFLNLGKATSTFPDPINSNPFLTDSPGAMGSSKRRKLSESSIGNKQEQNGGLVPRANNKDEEFPEKADTSAYVTSDGIVLVVDTTIDSNSTYTVPNTNIILDFSNSMRLYHEYIQKLPPKDNVPQTVNYTCEDGLEGFSGTIMLENEYGKYKFTGPDMKQKLLARRAACFVALRYLHKKGYISDTLKQFSKFKSTKESSSPESNSNTSINKSNKSRVNPASEKAISSVLEGLNEDLGQVSHTPPTTNGDSNGKLKKKRSKKDSNIDDSKDAGENEQDYGSKKSMRAFSILPKGPTDSSKKEKSGVRELATYYPEVLNTDVPVAWPATFYTYVLDLKKYPNFPSTEIMMLSRNRMPDGISVPLNIGEAIVDITPTFNNIIHLTRSSVETLCDYMKMVLRFIINKFYKSNPDLVNILFSPLSRGENGTARVDFDKVVEHLKYDTDVYTLPVEQWGNLGGKLALNSLQAGSILVIDHQIPESRADMSFEKLHRMNGMPLSSASSPINKDDTKESDEEGMIEEKDGFNNGLCWIDGIKSSNTRIADFRHHNGKKHFKDADSIASMIANVPYHVPMPDEKVFLHAPLYKTKRVILHSDYTLPNPDHLVYTLCHGQPVCLAEKKNSMRSDFASPVTLQLKKLDLVDLNNMSLIPSFLFRLHNMLILEEFKQRFDTDASDHLLRQALTSGVVSSDNYQRLELLGDSVLKLIVTSVLFSMFPGEDEGKLSACRSQVVSNKNLCRVAKENGFEKYLWHSKFHRKSWLPPSKGWEIEGYHAPDQNIEHKPVISDKMYADLIESVLGACYLSSGIEGAVRFFNRLGILNAPNFTGWDSLQNLWETHPQFLNMCEKPPPLPLEANTQKRLEDTIGYRYSNSYLIAAALISPGSQESASNSKKNNSFFLKNYEGLEFLGDSLIDIFITEHYYFWEPELSPGEITLVKHIAVSNAVLGLISVRKGLDSHFLYGQQTALDAAKEYKEKLEGYIEKTQRRSEKYPDNPKAKAESWLDIPPECWYKAKAPKWLGDIVESLIGSVFVDSKWDFEAARAAFSRIIHPFIKKFIVPGDVTIHPVIRAQILIQSWGCTQFTFKPIASLAKSKLKESKDSTGEDKNSQQEDGRESHTCLLQLHKITFAQGVDSSISRARYLAAKEFVRKYSHFGSEAAIQKICTCRNSDSQIDSDASMFSNGVSDFGDIGVDSQIAQVCKADDISFVEESQETLVAPSQFNDFSSEDEGAGPKLPIKRGREETPPRHTRF